MSPRKKKRPAEVRNQPIKGPKKGLGKILASFRGILEPSSKQNLSFALRFPILLENSHFCFNIASEGILVPNKRLLGPSKVIKSTPRTAKRPSTGAQDRPKPTQEQPIRGKNRPNRGPRKTRKQTKASSKLILRSRR